MATKTRNEKEGNRLYLIALFGILFIVALTPMFFYYSKFTENPNEFKESPKNFIMLEGTAVISPEVLPYIKVGDLQYDHNGEETARIISVLGAKPWVVGKASFNGGDHVDIVDPNKKVIALAIKIRYDKVGDDLWLHAGNRLLKVGKRLELKFPKYYIMFHIIEMRES